MNGINRRLILEFVTTPLQLLTVYRYKFVNCDGSARLAPACLFSSGVFNWSEQRVHRAFCKMTGVSAKFQGTWQSDLCKGMFSLEQRKFVRESSCYFDRLEHLRRTCPHLVLSICNSSDKVEWTLLECRTKENMKCEQWRTQTHADSAVTHDARG